MANGTDCAICSRPASDGVKMRNSGVHDGLLVDCPQCGQYEFIGFDLLTESYHWTPELRSGLSCATRQAFEAGQTLRVRAANAREIAGPHLKTRVADNQERLLREIAKRASRPAAQARFLKTDFTLIDCQNFAEFYWYVAWMTNEQLGYQAAYEESSSGVDSISLVLHPKGWERVQPLPRQGGVPGRCFVAMWFDDSMNEVFELGISKAVTDSGLPPPIRIDQKEHNNQITDEIMAEIRDAEFVIADFSGNRGGVYYEAGFARGLGRPVIHCCREADFNDRHFDTKLINHIKWSDAADLRRKLANRIKATIIPKA